MKKYSIIAILYGEVQKGVYLYSPYNQMMHGLNLTLDWKWAKWYEDKKACKKDLKQLKKEYNSYTWHIIERY